MLKYVYNKKISLIIIVFLMATIFYFSHQTGQDSSKMSNNLMIRKLAHITEYAVLSFFIYAHLVNYKNIRFKEILAGFIAVVYAASDEYHQTLIPGRSGNPTDVLIDSIGVCIGIYLSTVIYKRINNR
ncbi:MAG: VanZ family protein [Gemella sp.]|nr:VanZ family protein [Gemella sp.]